MNKIWIALILTGSFNTVKAQQVPRQVIVEHFTNTYCSVCYNRNPGFYDNLKNFPQVMHIAYHPSSPYPACPLNQQNKPENDARTNYYGVYGSTPRLVLQGVVIPADADYSAPALFQDVLNQTSSFTVTTSLKRNNNNLEVRVVVKKVDTSSLTNVYLYAAVAEDTLHFNANNGETLHLDVFRKSFSGNDPIAMNAPVAIGDSTIYTSQVAISNAWNLPQLYAVAILSKTDKSVVQAGRSERLIENTTGIIGTPDKKPFELYPNPAKGNLYLRGDINKPLQIGIYNIEGKKLKSLTIGNTTNPISLKGLTSGIYLLKISNGDYSQTSKFVCE